MTMQDRGELSEIATDGSGAPVANPWWRNRVRVPGLDRFSGLYILAAVLVIFAFTIPGLFFTTDNLRNLGASEAVTAVLALGLILPLAAGVFDLSFAAIMGLSEVIAISGQSHGYNPVLSCVAAVVACAVVGVVNGIIVVRLHVNSFIATLGMSSILVAATYWVCNGGQEIVNGVSTGFTSFGTDQWLGIPSSIYFMVVLGIIIWFVLRFRPVGRYLYAVGGNATGARLAGVRVNRLIFGSLVISGTVAGLAGVLLAAQLGVGDPTAGPPYLLPAFTAVFLGATQITRLRRPNVIGTIFAIYVLAVGVNGLQLAGAPSYINDLFNGAALIAAVALAMRVNRSA